MRVLSVIAVSCLSPSVLAAEGPVYEVLDATGAPVWSKDDGGKRVAIKAGQTVPAKGRLSLPAKATVSLRWNDGVTKDGLVVATASCGTGAALEVPLATADGVKAACADVTYKVAPLEGAGGARASRFQRVMRGAAKVRGAAGDGACFDQTVAWIPRAAEHLFGARKGAKPARGSVGYEALAADLAIARLAYVGRFAAAGGVAKLCERPGAQALIDAGLTPASRAEVRETLAGCSIVDTLACLAADE